MVSTVLYVLNNTSGENVTVIQPNTFDGAGGVQRNTDLTLYGNGTPSWGERFDDNFYRLLENFAVQEQTGTLFVPQNENTLGVGYGINKAILGQIWYNQTRQQLFIQTQTTGNTSGWAPINNVLVAASSLTPTTIDGQSFIPRIGELVFNALAGSLQLYNGTAWINPVGGVVSKIIAGTGITISPTTGVGIVTINSSGSGGSVSSISIVESSGATGSVGLKVTGSPITTSGTITLTLSQELTGLSQLSSSGFVARTGTGVYTPRIFTAGTGLIISNGAGATGNPIISAGVIPIANGGTGQITPNAGFNALAPTTTTGDLIIRSGSVNTRLPIGAANTILSSTGTTAAWVAPLGVAQTGVCTSDESNSGSLHSSGFLTVSLLANSYYSFELGVYYNPYANPSWVKPTYTGTTFSSMWFLTITNPTGGYTIPGIVGGFAMIVDNNTPSIFVNAWQADTSPTAMIIKGFIATGSAGTFGFSFGASGNSTTLKRGSYITLLKTG